MLKKICLVFSFFVLTSCTSPQNRTSSLEKDLAPSMELSAENHENQREYLMAAEQYLILSQKSPTDPFLATKAARNLRYGGESLQALTFLKPYALKFHNNIELQAEYGKTLIESKKAHEAIKVLEKTLLINENRWDILSALGIAYDNIQNHKKAQEYYDKALVFSQNNKDIINNKALSLARSGKIKEAIKLLEPFALRPDANIQHRQNLAMLKAFVGKIDETKNLVKNDLPEEMAKKNLEFYNSLQPKF